MKGVAGVIDGVEVDVIASKVCSAWAVSMNGVAGVEEGVTEGVNASTVAVMEFGVLVIVGVSGTFVAVCVGSGVADDAATVAGGGTGVFVLG